MRNATSFGVREGISNPLRLIFVIVLDIKAREGLHLVSIAVESVRQDQQRRRPKADENAEALCVGFLLGVITIEELPDSDREDDGDVIGLAAGAGGGSAGASG